MPLKNFIIIIISSFLCLGISILPAKGQDIAGLSSIKCVVIDPGHGGKHPGAISKDRKLQEKEITLSVALQLGELIQKKYPKIKVIYTRTTDKYVDLNVRAEIANKNKADLFISIHVNSTVSTIASGTETFVMGTSKSKENFEVCKTENSVITVEDNYQSKYEGFDPSSPESYIIFSLLQNTHIEQSLILASHVQNHFSKGPIYVNRGVKQGGLLVLWKTTMPSILTEIGFISNPKDKAIISNPLYRSQIAEKLFLAFEDYKNNFEQGTSNFVSVNTSPNNNYENIEQNSTGIELEKNKNEAIEQESQIQKTQNEQKSEIVESSDDNIFTIQIMSVAKKLKSNSSEFKGLKNIKFAKFGNLYKYYIGEFKEKQDSKQELKRVKNLIPGAFVTNINKSQLDKLF